MKKFTSFVVLVPIICTSSAQKKSHEKKDDTPKVVATKPAPAKPAPSKPEAPVYRPADAISKPTGDNNKPRPITNVDVRDDIRPTAKPVSAALPSTDATHAVSRENLESDGVDSTAIEEPDSNQGDGNSEEIAYSCNTLSFQTLRCNQRWFRMWYRNLIHACTWTGDVTFVNTTDTTLVLYVQQRDAELLPTIADMAMPSLANQQNYNNLEILPGDSLTFKMPCGGLVYEAVQKQDRKKRSKVRHAVGWVRSVSADVRVAIKEEDLE